MTQSGLQGELGQLEMTEEEAYTASEAAGYLDDRDHGAPTGWLGGVTPGASPLGLDKVYEIKIVMWRQLN